MSSSGQYIIGTDQSTSFYMSFDGGYSWTTEDLSSFNVKSVSISSNGHNGLVCYVGSRITVITNITTGSPTFTNSGAVYAFAVLNGTGSLAVALNTAPNLLTLTVPALTPTLIQTIGYEYQQIAATITLNNFLLYDPTQSTVELCVGLTSPTVQTPPANIQSAALSFNANVIIACDTSGNAYLPTISNILANSWPSPIGVLSGIGAVALNSGNTQTYNPITSAGPLTVTNNLIVENSHGSALLSVNQITNTVSIGTSGLNAPINFGVNGCADAVKVFEFTQAVTNAAGTTYNIDYPDTIDISTIRNLQSIANVGPGTTIIQPDNSSVTGYLVKATSSNIQIITAASWSTAATVYVWMYSV